MMRFAVSYRIAAILITLSSVSACGGSGGSASPDALPAVGGTAAGTFSLFVPAAQSGHVRRQDISPFAQSASIVAGSLAAQIADISSSSPLCTTAAGGRTCSIRVNAPTGNDMFTVTLFDAPNAGGNKLGLATFPVAVNGPGFSANATVNGIPASVTASGIEPFVSGTPATRSVTVNGVDADGHVIIGSFDTPITLGTDSTVGGLSLSPTQVSSSDQAVTITYDGTAQTGTSALLGCSAIYGGGTNPTGCHATPASTIPVDVLPGTLYVENLAANGSTGSFGVSAYAPNANGTNLVPVRTPCSINGATACGGYGLAIDGSGTFYMDAGEGTAANPYQIFVLAAGTSSTSPLAAFIGNRVISGPNTGLQLPSGLAVTGAGQIYVANVTTNSVAVFASGANGNATPVQLISGPATGLNAPEGIAVDSAGNIYVANFSANSIVVFAPTANGNAAPLRTITGSLTQLNAPQGIALNATGTVLYVANFGSSALTSYNTGATGNVGPEAAVSGALTTLNQPYGVAVDAAGNIYVGNFGNNDVLVFAGTANGNTAPIRTLSSPSMNVAGMIALSP